MIKTVDPPELFEMFSNDAWRAHVAAEATWPDWIILPCEPDEDEEYATYQTVHQGELYEATSWQLWRQKLELEVPYPWYRICSLASPNEENWISFFLVHVQHDLATLVMEALL